MDLKAVIILFTTVTLFTISECSSPPRRSPNEVGETPKPRIRSRLTEVNVVCPAHTLPTDSIDKGFMSDPPDPPSSDTHCCGSNIQSSFCFNPCRPVTTVVQVTWYGRWYYYENYTQCPCESSGSQRPFCPGGTSLRRTDNGLIYCCPSWAQGTDLCYRICEPRSPKAVDQFYKDGGTLAWEEVCVCPGKPSVTYRSQPDTPIESSASLATVSSIVKVSILLIVTIIQLQ